jgi:hypothetical protein
LSCLKMVSEYPLDSWEVWAWIFSRGFVPSPAEIARLNEGTPDVVNRKLYDYGGYALFTYTQLIVQNTCRQAVSISNIQVSKICQAPLNGPIFVGKQRLTNSGPIDGGTQLGFPLDSADPEARVAPGWDVNRWRREYVTGPPVVIRPGETHEFDIKAIALHHACKFSIVFTVVDGGRSFSQSFNDAGQPFRVSALLPGVLKREKLGSRPYAGYSRLYVGGDASPWHDGTWVRENPKTWAIGRRTYPATHA